MAVFGNRVTLSFVAVVAVSFLILLAMGWQVKQTRGLVKEDRRVIEKLCETTATLDAALVIPFLIETKLALDVLPPADRTSLVRRRNNLEIAHEELSAMSDCEEVR